MAKFKDAAIHPAIFSLSIVILSILPVGAVGATLKYIGKNYTDLEYAVGRDCEESIGVCYNDRGPYRPRMSLEFNVEVDGDLQANTSYDLVTSRLSDGIHYSDATSSSQVIPALVHRSAVLMEMFILEPTGVARSQIGSCTTTQ